MTDGGAVDALTVKEYASLFRRNINAIYKRIKRGAFVTFHVTHDGRSIRILVPSAMVARLRAGKLKRPPIIP